MSQATDVASASTGLEELSIDDNLLEYDDSELVQLVTFNLAEEEFAINILNVQEIIRMLPITRVPNAPKFVEGVINLRGKVIPVVDMRKRFKLASAAVTEDTRIIVVNLLAQTVGFVLDAVSEVLRLPLSVIDDPPAVVAGIGSEYMNGVGKLQDRLIILLDLERLLDSQEELAIEKSTI